MPHPICNPRGHSYLPRDQRLPRTAAIDPLRFAQCEAYVFGVDLYNHGFFWEAHDSWEACWRAMPTGTPHEHFFRGLIQAAASHLKITTAQIAGASALGNRACLLLRASASALQQQRILGVSVASFTDALEDYIDNVLRDDPPRHDPVHFPLIEVATGPRGIVGD